MSRDSEYSVADDEIAGTASGQGLIDGEEATAKFVSRSVQEDASLGLGLFDSSTREAKRRRSG